MGKETLKIGHNQYKTLKFMEQKVTYSYFESFVPDILFSDVMFSNFVI